MAGPVEVRGLKELRKGLREASDPKVWGRELRLANKQAAGRVADWSTQTARGMGGQQAHFADALRGMATQAKSRVEVAGKMTPAGKARANPAFWGRKSQDNWIGTGWDVGQVGEGPYAINETIARRMVQIEQIYGAVVDRVTREAFKA